MGAKSDYVTLRNARVLENQARLASLGLHKTIPQLREATASPKPKPKGPWNKKVYEITPLRRSQRINTTDTMGAKSDCEILRNARVLENQVSISSSPLAKSDYEILRNARVLENQARLASLGLHKTISQLREATASAKPKSKRSWNKKVYGITPLRRSQRINTTGLNGNGRHLPLRRSQRLRESKIDPSSPKQVMKVDVSEDGEVRFPSESEDKRPANAPYIILKGTELQLSAEASAVRCNSKGRGSVYNPVFGICCHFCRQKKLCGEEDCKRCGNFDVNEPCLGKTDCSVCHSSTGVFCRACLKVRYGEEMEEVRENKQWMCPHCIEAKGINPYWICNSSICLKKRNIAPTGIAIFRARQMGYESVAHFLMDELRRKDAKRTNGVNLTLYKGIGSDACEIDPCESFRLRKKM
ncbi:hypothetical protein K1719_023818 [Acacia pycnantha]|nr:hypothetical protein K1719_023772 [Acacia pycnantha]KAI9101574.1 hypothetical protein K1719_023818 [Acacia pycnantha]